MSYRLGCDIGGTFTDLMLVDDKTGRVYVHKLPSSPPNYADAVVRGVGEILGRNGVDPNDVQFFVHSSTVALNTLVERKGEKTALITTAGFRDVLEIGRATREHEYDLFQTRPEPLVPRHLRFGVRERMDWKGNVVTPLDESDVLRVARQLRDAGVRAVAIAFLHAYANPAHEVRAKELVLSVMPDAVVTTSSEVIPVYREYERTSTTVINAYVAPKVKGYLAELEDRLRALGLRCPFYMTQSSGGLMTFRAARERPVQMLMAGPAAGVIAAMHIARQVGFDRVLALDTGGTTQLISLVEGGVSRPVLNARVAGYPVRVPVVDVRAIGAGGGSIARVDGGRLRVGPDSAGARPGPVCYDQGGVEPTVTDADLVLGYLNPDFFLGGAIRLNLAKAERAIMERIARPLNLSLHEAAAGILEVVNAERMGAIRKLLIEGGHDPRDFVCVAFGGAGPVHAAELARELGLKAVIIPPHPGLLSPLGSLVGELRRDYVQTIGEWLSKVRPETVVAMARSLRERAISELGTEGIPTTEIRLVFQADVKYVGQLEELTIDVPDLSQGFDRDVIRQGFLAEHHRLFHYHTDEEVVLTNIRLVARYTFPVIPLRELPCGEEDAREAQKGERPAYFRDLGGMVPCPVYDRSRLRAGHVIPGPAIVEEYDSTTVVWPGQRATVDRFGSLIITNVTVDRLVGTGTAGKMRWV